MRKLYVKNKDGTFEQVAAILKTQGYVITKTKLELAFQGYIEKVTLHKCVKNQKFERLYFQKFLAFLKARDRSTIDEVTRSDVDSFESVLLTQMKASSVNRRFNTFKNFFAKCLEWKMIAENPCLGKKKRKEDVNAKIPWTEKIFQAFIKTCNGELQKIFLFLWLTGCRPMELKNLKWQDINYDDQSLILRCGKNAEVSRKFPITKEIDELLHSLKMKGPFVFSLNGAQVNNDRLYHACKVRLKSIDLGQYTVYGIRHGFGTRLARQGISAFYIAELMGHSKIDTTRKYVHSDKNQLIDILRNAK